MNAVSKAVRTELPPARLLNCTPEEYHKDPCEKPSLSASTAHVLVAESPLHAWVRHPKFGSLEGGEDLVEAEGDDTKAKTEGTILHKLLLGKGTEIVVLPFDSFRSNAARAARDEALAAGKVPCKVADFEALAEAAERLRTKLSEYGYDFDPDDSSTSEIGIEWYAQGLSGPVLCRSMLDKVFLDDGVILDLKKIRSANPRKIMRSLVEHGYDIQAHVYPRAVEALRPELAGRVSFTFLFVEIEPPYAVVPVELGGATLEVGKTRWETAVRVWEHCLAENKWPAYTSSVLTLDAPEYQINEQLGNWWSANNFYGSVSR